MNHRIQDDNWKELITLALREDLGEAGDLTTQATVAPDRMAGAHIVAREPCVICGWQVVAEVLRRVEERLELTVLIPDGGAARPGDVAARIHGPARGILTAERTALNFLQRLSGVATLTRKFTDRVGAGKTRILDTRKTTPGYRALEKYAVVCGGGANHRMGLYDRIMIKDNHRALWAEQQGGKATLADAVRRARSLYPGVPVEVEVESLEEFEAVLPATPEWILLDNMPPEQMRACVSRRTGGCLTEASGGITLDTIEAAAAAGVDAISLGCLTHSARAVDLSLEMDVSNVTDG